MTKLGSLEEALRITRSNAVLCSTGVYVQADDDSGHQDLLTLDELCNKDHQKAIKFEIDPLNKK